MKNRRVTRSTSLRPKTLDEALAEQDPLPTEKAYEPHPYAMKLKPLSSEKYEALKEDIKDKGIIYPIIVDEDNLILDGVHRYRICRELGIDPPIQVRAGLTDDEKLELAVGLNWQRRPNDTDSRCEMVFDLYHNEQLTMESIAGMLGISKSTVSRDLGAGDPPVDDYAEQPSTIDTEDVSAGHELLHDATTKTQPSDDHKESNTEKPRTSKRGREEGRPFGSKNRKPKVVQRNKATTPEDTVVQEPKPGPSWAAKTIDSLEKTGDVGTDAEVRKLRRMLKQRLPEPTEQEVVLGIQRKLTDVEDRFNRAGVEDPEWCLKTLADMRSNTYCFIENKAAGKSGVRKSEHVGTPARSIDDELEEMLAAGEGDQH